MLDREEVLCKAYEDCIREMFAKAQPSADWDNIIEEYRTRFEIIKEQRKIAKNDEIINLDAYRLTPNKM